MEVFGRKAIPASIRNEPTITGTAPRLWYLGPRAYGALAPHARAIQALTRNGSVLRF